MIRGPGGGVLSVLTCGAAGGGLLFFRCGGAGAGRDASQGGADREGRDTALAGDRLQAQALCVQVVYVRGQFRGELGRPLGPLPGRQQPGQPVLAVRRDPPPYRRQVSAERGSDLLLRRGFQLGHLHRGQSPPGLVAGVPGEGRHAVYPHLAAAARQVEQADAGGDLGGATRQPRQYSLGQPAARHDGPPHSPGYAFILSKSGRYGQGAGAGNYIGFAAQSACYDR